MFLFIYFLIYRDRGLKQSSMRRENPGPCHQRGKSHMTKDIRRKCILIAKKGHREAAGGVGSQLDQVQTTLKRSPEQ